MSAPLESAAPSSSPESRRVRRRQRTSDVGGQDLAETAWECSSRSSAVTWSGGTWRSQLLCVRGVAGRRWSGRRTEPLQKYRGSSWPFRGSRRGRCGRRSGQCCRPRARSRPFRHARQHGRHLERPSVSEKVSPHSQTVTAGRRGTLRRQPRAFTWTFKECRTIVAVMPNSSDSSHGLLRDDAVTIVVQHDRPRGVRLLGELDLAGVPKVRAALGERSGDVEVDCAGLTFIDASGLRVFVAAHTACRARGARLLIVNPSRCVVRLLELTGVDTLLDVRVESSAP